MNIALTFIALALCYGVASNMDYNDQILSAQLEQPTAATTPDDGDDYVPDFSDTGVGCVDDCLGQGLTPMDGKSPPDDEDEHPTPDDISPEGNPVYYR